MLNLTKVDERPFLSRGEDDLSENGAGRGELVSAPGLMLNDSMVTGSDRQRPGRIFLRSLSTW